MATSASTSPAYQRPHLNPRAPEVTTLWEEWLSDRLGTGWLATRIRVVRVSSSSRAVFIANLMASLAVADHRDPDVQLARELGVVLVENSKEGDELRAETGTYHLRLASLPGGAYSQRHLGYAVPIGTTLFIYLMGSAAEGNLRTSSNQEDWLNAATETIRLAIRKLAPAIEERLSVHWSDETRVSRSDQAAADILTTMRTHDVRLMLRDIEYASRTRRRSSDCSPEWRPPNATAWSTAPPGGRHRCWASIASPRRRGPRLHGLTHRVTAGSPTVAARSRR